MIEIHPKLFVGNQLDYETQVKGKPDWRIVHACKEPYHRQALGYKSPGAPRDHDEYLFAYRGDDAGDGSPRLLLNMVDAPKAEFFADKMIDEAIEFIRRHVSNGTNVLVHCNQGGSRAPGLAMLALRMHSTVFEGMTFEEAEDVMRNLYPSYAPANGIREYVRLHWSRRAPE